jgi:hypothetical protein
MLDKIYKNDALKMIAMLTMLIDHLGVMFFPEYRIFRTIGRIAFPIFAFYIAIGFQYTSSRKKYLNRLVVLGILSQLPYMFLNPELKPLYLEFNVVLLFVYAIGMLYVVEWVKTTVKNKEYHLTFIAVATVLIIVILPEFVTQMVDGFYLSYGMYGLVMILLFYALSRRPLLLILSYIVFSFIFAYLRAVNILSYYTDYSYFESLIRWKDITDTIVTYDDGLRYLQGYFFQSRSILGVVLIVMLSRFPLDLHLNKFISYLFYPIHMIIVILIAVAL